MGAYFYRTLVCRQGRIMLQLSGFLNVQSVKAVLIVLKSVKSQSRWGLVEFCWIVCPCCVCRLSGFTQQQRVVQDSSDTDAGHAGHRRALPPVQQSGATPPGLPQAAVRQECQYTPTGKCHLLVTYQPCCLCQNASSYRRSIQQRVLGDVAEMSSWGWWLCGVCCYQGQSVPPF